jgi:hypothetical protein
METNAPSKLPITWFTVDQIGVSTWGKLKAKLTGIKSQFGNYFSHVNISESDADKLIENIKKSGRYPVLDDESGDNLETYENWLVDTYLKSASTEYKSDGDKEKKNESVKVESKKDSAPPLYEGVRETDLVEEEIDERILEILGLEEVYDFTYGEYKQLLFTELQKIDRGEEKSTDRAMLLQDEFKRIKGKVGKFKLKKKKITAESIGTTGPIQISKDKFFLTSRAIVPTTSISAQESSEDINDIEKALDDILKSLTLQNKEKKKRTDEERKKSEDRRRRQREGDLEKPLSQLKSLAKRIIAPAQGILDRIFRFIKFTLLGYAFNQLVNWFSDPKNADKVKVLGRFLKDWWPSLLFAYGLFATPFGKFIRVTLKLLRGLIPQMVKFIAKHPFAFAGVTAALAVGGAEMWRQQKEKGQIEKESQKRNVKPEVVQREVTEAKSSPLGMIGETFSKIGPLGMFNTGGLVRRKSFFGGGEIQKELDINQIAFAEGGGVDDSSGVRIKGAGPDTQLIAAAPGEVVMSKKAVDKYGANFFLDLNKKAGGTNIPKMANNIQLAAGGGLIKRTIKSFQGGGMVGNALNQLGRFLPGTGRVMAPKGMNLGFQNKFLGMNIGKIKQLPINQTYSPAAVDRYNSNPSAPSTLSKFGTGPLAERHVSIPKVRSDNNPFALSPSSVSRPPSKPPTGLNLNLKQNIQIIRGSAKKQELMMKEMGYEPDGYTNLRGQPINMGPQSRSVAPGPPVIVSKTTYTVLPPIKAPNKQPSIARGSKLPEFIISSNNDSRSKIASSLGIADLVGVA